MRAEVKPSVAAPKGRVTPDVDVRLAEDADGPALPIARLSSSEDHDRAPVHLV